VYQWEDEAFLAEAQAWIESKVVVTGEIAQPHVRWWSTVLRVPTTEGDAYFKAAAPVHRFEAALTALLCELQPGRVPDVLAADADRGWMLMRDGGLRLRELIQSRDDLYHWERLLPTYAQLQIDVADHSPRMLAFGVPDERLSVIPAHLAELLDARPPGLSDDERQHLVDAVPRVEDMCRELGAYAVPETIQHDDLHDGQLFVRDGAYRVFDWGDSCVSHPFHTLTVTLRAAAWRLDLVPGGRELERLRDAYLEPFAVPGEAAALAYRTGTIARSLAWHRMVSAREPEFVDDEDATSAAHGLKLFLANGPIGTWRDA
jgi:hypothetical protein